MKEQYKWDLSKIFQTEQQIKEAIEEVQKNLETLTNLRSNSKDNIYELLELDTKLGRTISKLYTYASMKRDENSQIAQNQKLALETETLMTKVSAETSFIAPFLLGLSEEDWEKIKDHPLYEKYKLMFQRLLREKKHMLSEEQEFLLSSFQEVASTAENTFYMLSYADMKFPIIESSPNKETLTHANYVKLLMNSDRTLRKEAFEKMYHTYGNYENTFASTLFGAIKNAVTTAKLRGFSSAREMALYSDDVNLKVYDSLIESVHDFLPSLYRYFDIKKNVLNLEKFHLYDAYVNIAKNYDRKIEFEDAKQIVLNALKPLGEDYCSIIQKAFDENWIDVYPREGKKAGAYSWGCYDSDPYILMNYNDNLESVFTLIHELGHSVHSYLSRKNNEFIYSSYTIFVAEVASTTNEMLLINYLLSNSNNKEEQLYLINYYIDMFKSTVFRQTMFAEFEKITHQKAEQGEALTANELKEIYYDLNKLYFGENVEIDKEIALEWARIPHFYSNFYVYKYATGLSAAAILSQRILNRENGALEQYLTFLKDGNKDFPIIQLQKAGADMTDKKSVEQGLLSFQKKIEELDALTK